MKNESWGEISQVILGKFYPTNCHPQENKELTL